MGKVVAVLTSKSLETMFREGGSGHWVANGNRIRRCKYLIAIRHGHSGWSQDEKPHNSAFLIGRNLSVIPAEDRLIIGFSEYSEINIPNAWPGNRNPVAYKDLADFDIDVSELRWIPFPADQVVEQNSAKPLTIEEAKQGIAKALGITKECIEITIRA
jgi:hypothetical protein